MVDPVDYSAYLARIADALEGIETQLEGIKTNTDTELTYLSTIKNDITRVRDLGDRSRDGTGFRTIEPYNELSLAILWLLYIERGKILEFNLDDATVTDLLDNNLAGNEAVRSASIARAKQLFDRLKASFDAWGDA